MSKKQPRVMLPRIRLDSLVSMANSSTSLSGIKIEQDSEDSDNDIDMVEIGPEIPQESIRTSQTAQLNNKNRNKRKSDYKQKCLQKYEAAKQELLSMLEHNADVEDGDEETSENHKPHAPNNNSQKSDKQVDNSTLAKVLNNQQLMLQMLKTLSHNQKKLTQEVSVLSVKLDETYLNLLLRENSDTTEAFKGNTFNFRQLQTREDLEEFELRISDENEKRRVMNNLTYLCNSNIEGASCFYRLIDVLLSRQLVNEYSWGGGSRGDTEKMPFKIFKNTIDFIFQLVNFWDPNFTLKDTETFLKLILKYAKKRMESKLTRASTTKNRKRKTIEIAQIDVHADLYSEYEDNTQNKPVPIRRKLTNTDSTNVVDEVNHAVKLAIRKRRQNTETDDSDEEITKTLKLPIKIRKQMDPQENEYSDGDIEIKTRNKSQSKQQAKITQNIISIKQIKPQINEDSASDIDINETQSEIQKKNIVYSTDDYVAESSGKVNKNKHKNSEIVIKTAEEPRNVRNKTNEDTDNEEDCMDYEQKEKTANLDSDSSENSEKSPEYNNQRSNIINHEITKTACSKNIFGMKLIENIKEFEEFEALISKITEKQKLMDNFSVLCTPTIGKGVTFAYRLIDEMFSRQFLRECSWCGGNSTSCKDKVKKIPLKTFKNTVHFFFLMVNFWDPEFSMETSEMFLKNILKYANRRAEAERSRGPRQVHRFCRKLSGNNKSTLIIKDRASKDSEMEIEIEAARKPIKLQNTDNEEDCMDYGQQDNLDSDGSENSEKSPEHSIERSNNTVGMKPIENLKEFEEFEARISNITEKEKLMNHFSNLCTPTMGRGVTFAYRLIDDMFSRQFLRQCSWCGGNKTKGDGRKIPFRTFTNTVQFFYLMVNFWDSEYSIESNAMFLKNILKYSNKRAKAKGEKAPYQRNGPHRNEKKQRSNYNQDDESDIHKDIVLTDRAATCEGAEGSIDVLESLETAEIICQLFNNSDASESSLSNNKSAAKYDETPESLKLNLLNIKPINNLQELDKFEKQIADTEKKKKLIEKYSVLCPKSIGNGTAFAYNLLTSMFTKDFLSQCNWVGVGKIGEPRVPIKQYKNMLNFIFQIVNYWDPNYSYDDLQTFFNVVLKKFRPRHLPAPVNLLGHDEVTTMLDINEVGLFDKDPIETVEELQDFEKLLSDNKQRTIVKSQLSVLFPISLGKGITCAYRLIDTLFSRQFLCECSWSGVSRGDNVKICFKVYNNIINFVYQMVSFWDPSYTEENNKEFLVNVMKNANKRASSKNMRASTQRKRMRKQRNSLYDEIDPLSLTFTNENGDEESAQNFLRLFKDTLQSDDDEE